MWSHFAGLCQKQLSAATALAHAEHEAFERSIAHLAPDEQASKRSERAEKIEREREEERRHRELCESIEQAGHNANFWSFLTGRAR